VGRWVLRLGRGAAVPEPYAGASADPARPPPPRPAQVGFRHEGFLRPGGALVMKVYEGAGTNEFIKSMQPYFTKVTPWCFFQAAGRLLPSLLPLLRFWGSVGCETAAAACGAGAARRRGGLVRGADPRSCPSVLPSLDPPRPVCRSRACAWRRAAR
jgi:hypothetical protein